MLDFKRFRMLTFDCYGTLINWERGIVENLQPILQAHGVALTDEQLLAHYAELEAAAEAGPYQTYRTILQRVVDGFGARFAFTTSEPEHTAFAGSVGDWPPFADSAAALQELAARFSLVVLSNVDDDLFAGSARQLGNPFTRVITAQQLSSYKPALRNFQALIEQVGVPQEAILHVAQSLYHDIAPARQLGLATVWVDRRRGQAGSGATPPANAQPDLIVPDLATLARLVREQG